MLATIPAIRATSAVRTVRQRASLGQNRSGSRWSTSASISSVALRTRSGVTASRSRSGIVIGQKWAEAVREALGADGGPGPD